ncbi:MAG TPA: hypothetical protein VHW01_29830, partial [Polyangiaceae bacterium]|nr:hypothetical protein [Polyangiaceae bacterium]
MNRTSMSQLRPLLTCMLLGACPIFVCFACSVIDKYDDVVPAKTAGGGEGGTNAGGSHSGGNSTGGLDDVAGEAGVPSANTNGGSGGSTPGVPTHGLLAVAGTDPTKLDGSVVSLI